MKYFALWACVALLGACDAIRAQVPSQTERHVADRAYQYRVVSIERNVVDLPYTRNRTVSFTGKIEFSQSGTADHGAALLYGKLRTETEAGTDENDIVVLLRDGRGEYNGSLRYIDGLPLNQDAPQMRADQISVTVTGVVPMQSATLTPVASQPAASTPAQPQR